MRTAIEIDRDGTPLRVFHRRGNSAWTYPIDDPTYRTHGRHDVLVRRPCPVCVSADKTAPGRIPEAAATAGAAYGEALP